VPEEVYLSHRQAPYLAMSVILRTSGEANALVPAVRESVLAHPPSQPPHQFVSFPDLLSASTSAERFLAVFMAMFAAASLILATGGVYGVVARSVAARKREMGIRIALGAEAGSLVRRITLESARIAGIGVVAGILAALLLGRTVQGLLYGVSASQPAVLIGLAGGLLAVATGAALLSARPIARLDPSETLRRDQA
jgi:ABC-type antimicrobial peptide transport system permease subunit